MGTWALGPEVAGASSRVSHAAFDRILRENVREGRVDYLNIRARRWADLIGYLDQMATVDPTELRPIQRWTYYINLYNATVIRTVAERFRAGYSVAENEYAVFDEKLVGIAGVQISLNELEHERIRPEFRDPRVHAALVCAAVSCPPLMSGAMRPVDLDATLNRLMRDFVNDSTRNRVDPDGGALQLSSIFDWYAPDFADSGGVRRYVAGYLGMPVPAKVEFLDYDWSLNLAQPRGRWVRVVDEGTELQPLTGTAPRAARENEVFEVVGEEGSRLRIDLGFGKGQAWVEARYTAPFHVESGGAGAE